MANRIRPARSGLLHTVDVPPLQGGDVHVWQWDLDAGGSVAGHEAELDVAERARLRRFRREVDARRYAAGRSGLRCILGAYTGHEPQRVPLTVGEYGKPELAGGGSLYFNLSHSENVALLAVTELGRVGVDVERVGVMPELEAVADRFFTRREARALRSAEGRVRERLFFRLWTRKESYLKAVGGGLAIPLDSVDLSVLGPPMVLGIDGEPDAAGRWSLAELDLGVSYAGAVAVEAPRMQVEHLPWDGLVHGQSRSASAAYLSGTGGE